MVEFITEKGANTLRNFKYKGGSVAYSYENLWSPLAQKVVGFVPMTVAPNLITVVGTLIHILGNLALILQEQGKFSWKPSLLFFAVCVFVYYTLDNVDGKQARRTKNSTPLGMCMDHGCDILGVSFIALGVSRMVLIDDNLTLIFTAQIAVVGSFWMSVWSQYHSQGQLILGKINAVDDGIPFIAFLGLISFIFGQQIWLTPIYGSFTLNYALVAFIWVGGVFQTIGFVSSPKFTKNIKGALTHLIHFPLLSLSLLTVVTFTKWHEQHFFALYFTTILIVVRDTSYMHVCVVAEDKYNQWQPPTLVYIIVYPILVFLCKFTGASEFWQTVAVYSMLVFTLYKYLSYVIKISRQMSRILGVRIFHIQPPQPVKNN